MRHLTQDWDPAFREEITRSTDRSRPEQLRATGAKDAGNRPMSASAEQALQRAREAAKPVVTQVAEDSPESHG